MKRIKFSFGILAGVLLGLSIFALPSSRTPGKNPKKDLTPQERTGLIQAYRTVQRELPAYTDSQTYPLIKKDKEGQAWIVWEEQSAKESQIWLGCLEGSTIIRRQIIASGQGCHYAPDIAFDRHNSPWVAWVHALGSQSFIHVQKVFERQNWTVASASLHSYSCPKIIIDDNNSVWLFWEGSGEGKRGIFYRVFNRLQWSPTGILPGGNSFPHTSPSPLLDSRGILWLAWSNYDGRDYEILLSTWTGEDWAEPARVTDDDGENDCFPSFFLARDGNPILGWASYSLSRLDVCLQKLGGPPSQEPQKIRVASPALQSAIPRMFAEGDLLGLVWSGPDRMDIQEIDLASGEWSDGLSRLSDTLLLPPSATLDENTYIGFGDSITYGYLDREPYPEEGYIPRLEQLLTHTYGPSTVFNEGFPGEKTYQGIIRIDDVLQKHSAQYLLLMEATNDVIHKEISIDTVIFNLREMVRKCLEAGVFPTLATIIPRRDRLWAFPHIRERLTAVNEGIRSLAADLTISFVDMFDTFNDYPAEDGGLLSLLSGDLHHPSIKGYQVMAEEWFDEIRDYPFPPVNLEISKKDWFSVPSATLPGPRGPISLPPAASFFSNNPEAKGNLIAWKENPKIYDGTRIGGYRIYRKTENSEEKEYQLLAFISDSFSYLDPRVIPSQRYEYLISAVRIDGVEGPFAGPISQETNLTLQGRPGLRHRLSFQYKDY